MIVQCFLKTWITFDVDVTSWCLEVLGATTTTIISLQATQISVFLDFPNTKKSFDLPSTIFTHAFVLLAYCKPNISMVGFSSLCFINPGII
jgi:hypothetical protein